MTTAAFAPAFAPAFAVPQTGGHWLDPADVAVELGDPALAAEPRLLDRTRAAQRQVEVWRDDLDLLPLATTAQVKASHPHLYTGAVLYATLLWEARNTPDGFPGFDTYGGPLIGGNDKMLMVRRLVRVGRPKVG